MTPRIYIVALIAGLAGLAFLLFGRSANAATKTAGTGFGSGYSPAPVPSLTERLASAAESTAKGIIGEAAITTVKDAASGTVLGTAAGGIATGLTSNVELFGVSTPAVLPFAGVAAYSNYVHENLSPATAAIANPVIELPYQTYKRGVALVNNTITEAKKNPVQTVLTPAVTITKALTGGGGGTIQRILGKLF